MKVKAFAIIPRKDEIEIKPIVLCKECRHYYCGCTAGHDCPDGGDWYCADGEKREEKPTVDAVPVKHGRWVELDRNKGMADHKCTLCGLEVYVPTSWGEPLYNYCPVCGAKMDLEEVNDEAD